MRSPSPMTDVWTTAAPATQATSAFAVPTPKSLWPWNSIGKVRHAPDRPDHRAGPVGAQSTEGVHQRQRAKLSRSRRGLDDVPQAILGHPGRVGDQQRCREPASQGLGRGVDRLCHDVLQRPAKDTAVLLVGQQDHARASHAALQCHLHVRRHRAGNGPDLGARPGGDDGADCLAILLRHRHHAGLRFDPRRLRPVRQRSRSSLPR